MPPPPAPLRAHLPAGPLQIAAEAMHNYMFFGQKLVARVLAPEEVHEELFKGANRVFKKVGRRAVLCCVRPALPRCAMPCCACGGHEGACACAVLEGLFPTSPPACHPHRCPGRRWRRTLCTVAHKYAHPPTRPPARPSFHALGEDWHGCLHTLHTNMYTDPTPCTQACSPSHTNMRTPSPPACHPNRCRGRRWRWSGTTGSGAPRGSGCA